METNNRIRNILKLPLWTAGISFALGTILLLLYLINKEDYVMVLGFIYIAGAFIVNLVVLFVLLILSNILAEYRRQILEATAVMLLNIPVA
jgi:lipid-A-disaccharide synthase-like uncharacterized protein